MSREKFGELVMWKPFKKHEIKTNYTSEQYKINLINIFKKS